MFDNLPVELQDVILQRKDELETATYDDFLESFDIRVLSRKTVRRYSFSPGVTYIDRLLVHYKPFNKFMITNYEHSENKNNDRPIKDIIQWIMYGIESYKEECDFALENQYKMKAYHSISYNTYLTINSNDLSPMTLKQFCEWRKECNDFRLMLGTRYDTFMTV
jgi:hypothetical protein